METPCQPIKRFCEAVVVVEGSGEAHGSVGGEGSENEVMDRDVVCEDLEEEAWNVVGCVFGFSGNPNGVVEAERSFLNASVEVGVCHG